MQHIDNYKCVIIVSQALLVSVSVGYFSHVLLLLVKVPLIVFLHYDMYVDVSVLFSQLVVLGKNDIHY